MSFTQIFVNLAALGIALDVKILSLINLKQYSKIILNKDYHNRLYNEGTFRLQYIDKCINNI
jgi:hypothetical protein